MHLDLSQVMHPIARNQGVYRLVGIVADHDDAALADEADFIADKFIAVAPRREPGRVAADADEAVVLNDAAFRFTEMNHCVLGFVDGNFLRVHRVQELKAADDNFLGALDDNQPVEDRRDHHALRIRRRRGLPIDDGLATIEPELAQRIEPFENVGDVVEIADP